MHVSPVHAFWTQKPSSASHSSPSPDSGSSGTEGVRDTLCWADAHTTSPQCGCKPPEVYM